MEISEFIEQDILIFLDDRLDAKAERPSKGDVATPTIFITRDYEKDLTSALSEGSVPKAKQVLHALKEQFDTCPPGTDRERLKDLLNVLYERFKDYLDAHNLSIADPALGIRAMSAPQTSPSPSPSPPTPMAQPAQQPEEAAPRAVAPVNMTSIIILRQQIETALAAGNGALAAQQYRQAKKELLKMNAVPNELTLQFITLYGRIKQLAQEQRDAHAASAPIPPAAPTRTVLTAKESATAQQPTAAQLDSGLLLQLEREKRELDIMLQRGDLHAAMLQYKRMRIIAQQLHNPGKAIEKLQRIYTIINTLKQHSSNNEQQLARASP